MAVLALSVTPAFGQAVAIEEGDDVEYNGVCQNIIGSIGDINAGNTATADSTAVANATADNAASPGASADAEASGQAEATAEAVAEIAQESGVSIEQVNECLNGTDTGETDTDDTDTSDADDDDDTLAAVDDPGGVDPASIPKVNALVNTGGMPLLGLALASLAVSVVAISVFSGGSRR